MNLKTAFFALCALVGYSLAALEVPAVAVSGSAEVASSYVLYGARFNKEPCLWSYAEVAISEPLLGGPALSLWQNTDLTGHRSDVMRRINEWDWTASYRISLSLSGDWALAAEAGHIWYCYAGLASAQVKAAYKTMMEVFARFRLDNPYLVPHLFVAHDWQVCGGTFAVGGLKRDFSLPLDLTLTCDLTAGGGDARYLAALYPPWGAGSVHSALTYAQLAVRLSYPVSDFFGVHVQLAGTVLADPKIRAAVDCDPGDLRKQFVWGTAGFDFSF